MKAVDFTQLFANIPPLEGTVPADFTIAPLPGFTNDNFRLHNHGQDWVLRVPRASTNRFIDRAAEASNQAQACDLGIAPCPLWHDDSGLSLTPTLKSSRCLTAADFNTTATTQLIAATLGKLHRSGLRFRGRLQLDHLLERYYAMLPVSLQNEYRQRMCAARRLIPSVQQRDRDLVPSHSDPVLENLLLENDRLWLIDWEYSAMASPYWDLAIVCNAAGLDYRQSRNLLKAYCDGGTQMEESLLFDYRNLLQLLSDCWMAALVD